MAFAFEPFSEDLDERLAQLVWLNLVATSSRGGTLTVSAESVSAAVGLALEELRGLDANQNAVRVAREATEKE